MKSTRLISAVLLLLWLGMLLAVFFVVQRPLAVQVAAGIWDCFWALLLTAVFLLNSAFLGTFLMRRFFPFLEGAERFLLGAGLGLGTLGLSGFALAALGAAHFWVLLALQVAFLALGFLRGWHRQVLADLSVLHQGLRAPLDRRARLLPWLVGIAFCLSFLYAFAPPADSFDALFYHLVVPQAWLQAGGISVPGLIPHAWFPGLVEGQYLWALGLNSEMASRFIHLAWGVLTALLLWVWVQKVSGNRSAWRSLAILVSMPSLPLLAAWAYTDLALVFCTLAVLYLLWRSSSLSGSRRWVLTGIFCGLAMGIKYTSFLLPVFAFGWMVWIERRSMKSLLVSAGWMIAACVLVASPWYLRNWILVGNPVYPFVFGGRFWDPFLADAFQSASPGVGWNIRELLLLPLNITLGTNDANYYDGRIGPWFLILLPVCLWSLWRRRRAEAPVRQAVSLVALFALLSLVFWTVGVINTRALWQSRLLFPALIPFALLVALAWDDLSILDLPRLKLSFIVNTAVIFSILVILLDLGLFVLVRSPLSFALGVQEEQAYYEKFQPAYASALSLVGQTTPDAAVYFLFEPRSYGMARAVQPDPINANLAHLFYLHATPQGVLAALQAEGFTHVLYQRAGDELLVDPQASGQFFSLLELEAETPASILYRIP